MIETKSNDRAISGDSSRQELSGSLEKGLALIELLAKSETPLGVTQIANRLATGKSGIHRILQMMKATGWIRQTPKSEYECTLKLWELGLRQIERIDLRRLAAPYMRELASATQESIHLSILDGTDVLYLDKLDSPQAIRAYTHIGGRAPAYCVATGRALLAHANEAAVTAATHNMESFTTLTVTSPQKLRNELQQVRNRGYAINRGEWRGGVRGLAAPIFDASAHAIAAIGVAGPGERMTDASMRTYAPLVVAAARRISRDLGFAPGDAAAQN